MKEELEPEPVVRRRESARAAPGPPSGQAREHRRRHRQGEDIDVQAAPSRHSLRGIPLQRYARGDVPNRSDRKRQRIREPDPNERPLKRLRDQRRVSAADEPEERAIDTVPRRNTERRLGEHGQRGLMTRTKASALTAEPRRWPRHRSDEDVLGPRLPPLARRRTSTDDVGGRSTHGRGLPVVPRASRRLHTTSERTRQPRQQQQQQKPPPTESRSRPLTVPLTQRLRTRRLGEQEPEAERRRHRSSAPQQPKQKPQPQQERRQQQHHSQSTRCQKRPRSARDEDVDGEAHGTGSRPVKAKQETKEEKSKKKRRRFDEETCIFEEHAEDSDHWEMATRSSSGAASGRPPPEVVDRSRRARGEGTEVVDRSRRARGEGPVSKSRHAAPVLPRSGRNESADDGKRRRGSPAERTSAAVVGNSNKEEPHRRPPYAAPPGSTTKASSWEERQGRREAAARAALRHTSGTTTNQRGSAGSSPDRRSRVSGGRPHRA